MPTSATLPPPPPSGSLFMPLSELIVLITLVATLLIIVIVVFRKIDRSNRRVEQNLDQMHKALQQTSVVLHEYRKFKTAFDHAYDAMVITDPDGKILFINESAARVNGYRRSEVIGTKAGKLWGNLMPKAYYKQLWHQIKVEKKPWTGQFMNHRRDGTQYFAEVSISPIFDEDINKITNFVAVERVVSEADTSGVIIPAPIAKKAVTGKTTRRRT